MESLLRTSTVVLAIRAAILIQMATLAVCYFLWVNEGCDPFVPFISDTDTNPVSGLYFTIGFTLSGILLVYWAGPSGEEAGIGAINAIPAISAVIAGVSLAWIADTPWDEQLDLHLIQARLVFGGSTVWAISSTVITSRMSESDAAFSNLLERRKARTLFTLICMVGMAVSVISYSGLDLAVPASYLDSVRVCTDLNVTPLAMAATFEWLVALGLIAIIETCIEEARLLSIEP